MTSSTAYGAEATDPPCMISPAIPTVMIGGSSQSESNRSLKHR